MSMNRDKTVEGLRTLLAGKVQSDTYQNLMDMATFTVRSAPKLSRTQRGLIEEMLQITKEATPQKCEHSNLVAAAFLHGGGFTPMLYSLFYYDLLIERYKTHGHEMLKLAEMVKGTPAMPARDITVVCFCPADTFCHRHLMVNFFRHNWNVEYGGERKL